MAGPPEYLESNVKNVAALHVTNFANLGMLIYGFSPQGAVVFQVNNIGGVLAAGNMDVKGNISADFDVYARGVRLISDKNAKENFLSVNTLEVLDKLASVPIQTWNYKNDTSEGCHIGPTAQDFNATFGLDGDDSKHISTIDLQGVALAAIQGLNEKLEAENAELHKNLAKLEARLLALESKR
ncbi:MULTISPECIES: tail fiber domain-containing protein [Bacillus]|uniref:tail fiber domain-containing protein n=1 Tax=Bacillus TaxID=1386 RepID=UPI000CFDF760|nr:MULTISPECIES: tail fiber domain-containing protein [Bacillus]PQZ54620.1 hypothetical protein CQZ94_16990 [Bacillus sp. MYb209]